MSVAHDYETGAKVYLPSGRVAEYVTKTSAGHVVKLGNSYFDDDGCADLYFDDLSIERRVCADKPVPLFTEEMDQMHKEHEALSTSVRALRSEYISIEADHKNLLRRLEKHKTLGDIEAYLNGEIVCFVTTDYGQVKIEKQKAEGDRYNSDVRMLALLGEGKTDVSWKLNQYRDGSGSSWKECFPCTSEDQARAKAKEIITAELANMATAEKASYQTENMVKSAVKFGVDIPERLIEICKLRQHKEVHGQFKQREKDYLPHKEKYERSKAMTNDEWLASLA